MTTGTSRLDDAAKARVTEINNQLHADIADAMLRAFMATNNDVVARLEPDHAMTEAGMRTLANGLASGAFIVYTEGFVILTEVAGYVSQAKQLFPTEFEGLTLGALLDGTRDESEARYKAFDDKFTSLMEGLTDEETGGVVVAGV